VLWTSQEFLAAVPFHLSLRVLNGYPAMLQLSYSATKHCFSRIYIYIYILHMLNIGLTYNLVIYDHKFIHIYIYTHTSINHPKCILPQLQPPGSLALSSTAVAAAERRWSAMENSQVAKGCGNTKGCDRTVKNLKMWSKHHRHVISCKDSSASFWGLNYIE
jgi:hypothetical protein